MESGPGSTSNQTSTGSVASGQRENDATELELGKPIEREIAGGQRHDYQVSLTSGQFLHAVVEPSVVPVTVTLSGPDGEQIMKLAATAGSSEPMYLIAREQGIYRIEVRSEEGATSGSCLIRIEELRVATAQDSNRSRAQKTLAEGEQLYKEGTAESKRKAIKRYEQALPLCRSAGDRREEAETLSGLGSIYHELGDSQKALDYFNGELPLRRAVDDRPGEAQALNNIGTVYEDLGERQKALEYLNQALHLRRAVGDLDGEAETLNTLGLVYDGLGERQKALDHYFQVLTLVRVVGDRYGEAVTLNNIGGIYSEFGEMQRALDYFNRSLPLRRALGDRAGEAAVLSNIGWVYDDLGESQRALDYYNQALPLKRAVADRDSESVTLVHVGNLYLALGEGWKALDYYNHALPLARAVGDRDLEARTLTGMAEVYSSMRESQQALDYFKQSLMLRRAVGDPDGEGRTLNGMGLVYAYLGERQEALDHYHEALHLRRMVGDLAGEAATLANIAAVDREKDNLGDALGQIEAAIKIVESLRTKVTGEELRASYFSTVQNNYAFYVEVLMRLDQRHPDDRNEAKALEVAERSRARSLLDTLAEAQADIRKGADPALLERERSLRQLLKGKEAVQIKLLNGKHTEEQAAAIKKEIADVVAQYQEVEEQIRTTSPRYAALTQPQPLTAPEIQQQLDANTLLLEYALGDEHSYLWAVRPDSLSSFELPKRSAVETAARRFYDLLTARNKQLKGETEAQRQARLQQAETQYPQAAAALSRMLLGPVAPLMKGKRLVIVADGALQYIPFSALPEPLSGKIASLNHRPRTVNQASLTPLVVQHEIINLPSASVLAVLRQEIKGRQPAPNVVAVLADPVFDAHDPRVNRTAGSSVSKVQYPAHKPEGTRGPEGTQTVADAETASPAASLTESRLTRSAVEVGLGRGGELHFARLAFSRREAQDIVAAAPAGKGMMAVDFKANLQTATDPELAHYRIVHFATHGLLNSEHPELSGLVLSLVDEQGRPQDGFLQLQDIYNLNLPVDLVVLSACETALGKEIRGEGLMGLTRGFMYAGAPRVIASVWKVDDVATAELMKRLYRGMLTDGLPPAAALRQSQIEMWKQPRWQSSYYWAAFVIQGEWR